jgi:hypothetical protein
MGLRRRPSFFFFAVAFVIHSLVSLVAHGAEAPAEISSSISRATRTQEGLEWSTRWILSPAAARSGYPLEIRFAAPLPEGERLGFAPGVEAMVENDRIIGLFIHPGTIDGRTVRTTFIQPVKGASTVPLGAPVATGTTTQIIDGVLGPDTRLAVPATPILEKHVGYLATRAISHSARAEARRLTGYTEHLSGSTIYVRGDDVRSMGGLEGAIETQREAAQSGVIGVAALFAAILAALVVAVRRLSLAASVERADAILVSEIEKGAD